MNHENSDYSKQEYWEERYTQEKSYEWFNSRYEEILKGFESKMKDSDPSKLKILHLGCGNSSLGPDLYKRGFKNIVNLDYSSIVIENMSAQYSQEMPEMTWVAMDVRDLKFDDCSFDVVIDKAVMDTFQTNKESETLDEDIDKLLLESSRVLKKGGKFFQITWEVPHLRLSWTKMEKYNWDVEYEKIGDDDMYRIFTYTKTDPNQSNPI